MVLEDETASEEAGEEQGVNPGKTSKKSISPLRYTPIMQIVNSQRLIQFYFTSHPGWLY
jgi:hypothetical protein